MAEQLIEHRIKENANHISQLVHDVKSELSQITRDYNDLLVHELKTENAKLTALVEKAKSRLIQLETENNVRQIPLTIGRKEIPSSEVKDTSSKAETKDSIGDGNQNKEKLNTTKPVKSNKDKISKPLSAEIPVDIGRLDLRIAKIVKADYHPNAETLYVFSINCGDDNTRTVCSGLVNHVPLEELKEADVVLLCNLKPVKMRGVTSEAMIMCASSEQGVEVLRPPVGCLPGDFVHCEGYNREPDAVMNPKKKIFETVAPDLHTNDSLQACYRKTPLFIPQKGIITTKSLKNVPIK